MHLPANHDLLSIMEEVIVPRDRIMESLIMNSCEITCDTGYKLANGASATRMCQSDGTWSGMNGGCVRGKYCINHETQYLISRTFKHFLIECSPDSIMHCVDL